MHNQTLQRIGHVIDAAQGCGACVICQDYLPDAARKAPSYRQGVRDSLLAPRQEVTSSQRDGSGGNAEQQGCSRPHKDSNNTLLKGTITKRTLKGAMPASTARLTAALTLPAGKVRDIMSLCGGFYLIFFPQQVNGKQKANAMEPLC